MTRLTAHQPSLARRSRILAWGFVLALVLAWAAPPAGAQSDYPGTWNG